ncbi:MAG: helix-turn-helix domain-containing protein [Lentisphaeria bacterium]|nr:helix-turn-helix domain-containing protein [Candidatus Neomarinimicrobiota bacterium]MCF7842330.1 helix-turn-helix domain-containing protein [Lentisphaeria bacterium]
MMVRAPFVYLGIVNLLAGLQGFFLTIELAGRRAGNRAANRLLALFIGSFSLAILGTVLAATGWYSRVPHLIRIGDPFVFLLGPTLFLYVVAHRTGRFHPVMLIHLAPFCFYLLFLLPFYLQPGAVKIELVENGTLFNTPWMRGITLLKLVVNLAYLVATHFLVRRHRQDIREVFSEERKRNLQWIGTLVTMLFITWIVAALGFAWADWFGLSPLEVNITIAFIMAIFIYAMGYRGLRQPEISAPDGEHYPLDAEKLSLAGWLTGFSPGVWIKSESAVNQSVDPSTVRDQQYLSQLLAAMDDKKPYLRGDLTLENLSREVGLPAYLLSKVINERLNENFFEFVNRYRVEAVKARLVDPKNQAFTNLAIAYDCGFQSKSTFNEAFKRYTGMTPSQYKRQYFMLQENRQ